MSDSDRRDPRTPRIADLLGQTAGDLEVVVVDDESVPGASRWLDEARRRDDRLVLVRLDRPLGLPAVRFDEGFEAARGRERRPFATEFDGYPLPAAYRREVESTIDAWRDSQGGEGPRGTTTLLLLAGDSYHPALDLCFPPHPSTSPGSPALLPCYEPVVQATPESVRWSDGVVLVRTVTEPGFRLLQDAQAAGRPVAYYLDDDLLNLHRMGPPWDATGPGTERDREIRRQIAGADAVWSTSPRITEVVAPLNPRVVPHGGAVDEAPSKCFLAAWLATEFHARSRLRRGADGRPVVVYYGCVEGAGDEDLLDAAAIAERHGIRPLLAGEERSGLPARAATFGWPCWLRDGEGWKALETLLASEPVSLVHATRSVEGLESACQRFAVPLVVGCGTGTEARLSRPGHGARELFRRYLGALAGATDPEHAGGDAAGRSSAAPPGAKAEPAAAPAALPTIEPAGTLRDRLRRGILSAGLPGPLVKVSSFLRRRRVLVLFDADVVSIELYFRSVRGALERATGREWVLRPAAEAGPSDLSAACAVFFPRALSRRSVDLMAASRRAGCLTVYDADDNLLLIDQPIADPENPWRRVFGEARAEIEELIRRADVVKVYSQAAVPIFERLNPNVVCVRPPRPPVEPAAGPDPAVAAKRVGFFGSAYKDDEFPAVADAVGQLEREGDGPAFEVVGFVPRPLAALRGLRWFPWRSRYPEFRRFLATRGWTAGLAPLRDLEFNRCKTAAKYLEYASLGIAGVYSDVPTYREAVSHGVNGLLVDHDQPAAWKEAIERLVCEPGLRSGIVERAREDLLANYAPERYAKGVARLLRGA